MALFYPPPGPFVGGRQPYDPGRDVVPQVVTNNPPFGHLTRLGPYSATFQTVRNSWEPPPPKPFVPTYFPQVSAVSNPPFGHPTRQGQSRELYNALNAAWQPWTPYPYVMGQANGIFYKVPPPPPNPPFGHPALRSVSQSLNIWSIPPDPKPFVPTYFPQSSTVNNPPFGHPARRFDSRPIYDALSVAWQPWIPYPYVIGQANGIPYKIPPPPPNPPFAHPARNVVFSLLGMSWIPPDPQPVQLLQRQISGVDNPPKYSIVNQTNLRGLWEPPAPPPVQLVRNFLFTTVVNTPPFTHPAKSSTISALARQMWEPPIPDRVIFRFFTPSGPVVPPTPTPTPPSPTGAPAWWGEECADPIERRKRIEWLRREQERQRKERQKLSRQAHGPVPLAGTDYEYILTTASLEQAIARTRQLERLARKAEQLLKAYDLACDDEDEDDLMRILQVLDNESDQGDDTIH